MINHYLGDRLQKLNRLLGVEVSKILKSELELDDETFITVVKADVSPTLEHAIIWISVFPEFNKETVLQKINKKIYFLQQILNKRLVMRPVPKIRFEIDKTEEGAARIEQLIDNAAKS